ncbi:hypothetical protein U1Q18_011650 [Sarracenia purpurea var. burkii]
MPAKPEFPSRDFCSEAFNQASNYAAALVLLQPEIGVEIHSPETQIMRRRRSNQQKTSGSTFLLRTLNLA